MTDRVNSLTVALEGDMRVDDVQSIVEAIRMVRGVQHVELGPVTDAGIWSAHMARDNQWRKALYAFVREGPQEGDT